MGKYRKKPVVIEAVKWTGNNLREVTGFMQGKPVKLDNPMTRMKWEEYEGIIEREGLQIKTLEDGPNDEAKHFASVGDYIIKGISGEFYPCKPDIFHKTYDAVEDE